MSTIRLIALHNKHIDRLLGQPILLEMILMHGISAGKKWGTWTSCYVHMNFFVREISQEVNI
jgi:hypothetical protein